jgi:signal transduction histidine kinase
MNDSQIGIPRGIIQKWQGIVDLIAEIIQVPTALIRKIDPPESVVSVSNESENNPYKRGLREQLHTGLYCYSAMESASLLLVTNASDDDLWESKLEVNHGMVAYMGIHLLWPDNDLFGTIELLDHKQNEFNELSRNLLMQFRGVIESDLRFLSDQKQLIEYEKLSALGRLTANVAHEIRNPITVIGGLSERLRKIISPESKEKEYVDLIMWEVKRLEEVLRDVLSYSGKAFFLREQHDLTRILSELLNNLETVFNQSSIKTKVFFSETPNVYVDKKQVKAAINNLLQNAIDSMPNGGTLTIHTGTESLYEKNYVTVKISDTGVGISDENMKRIFEPLFTTKTTRKEIGLSLPITKKIMEGHGGFIKVGSSPGKGSEFSLYFPYRSK